MKKVIALVLILALGCLSGCGNRPEETEPADTLPPFIMTAPSMEEQETTLAPTLPPTAPPPVLITQAAEATQAAETTGAAQTEAPETEPSAETSALTEPTEPETEAPAEPEATEAPAEPGPTEETQAEGPDFPAGVVVSTPAVKVREGPTFSSKVVRKIPKNEYVVIYEVVQMDNQYWGRMDDGWVSMNYIRLEGDAPEFKPGNGVPALIWNTDAVNVRSEPKINSDKVDTLYLHDVIRVYEVTQYLGSSWARVENGWVSMKFVKLPQDPAPLYTDYEG